MYKRSISISSPSPASPGHSRDVPRLTCVRWFSLPRMSERWSTARTPTKALGFVVTVMATSPPASTVFGDTLTDTLGGGGGGYDELLWDLFDIVSFFPVDGLTVQSHRFLFQKYFLYLCYCILLYLFLFYICSFLFDWRNVCDYQYHSSYTHDYTLDNYKA